MNRPGIWDDGQLSYKSVNLSQKLAQTHLAYLLGSSIRGIFHFDISNISTTSGYYVTMLPDIIATFTDQFVSSNWGWKMNFILIDWILGVLPVIT